MGNYQTELWKACKEILHKGGEIRVNVTKRGQNRIIIIQKFPENYIRCDEETMVADD